MNISDILNKSSPLNKQKETSKSEYKKLVDRNTELIDKMKDLQERINKTIEYISLNQNKELSVDSYFKYKDLSEFDDILNILKGEDKE